MFNYQKAVEMLFKGIPVRRKCWPARNFVLLNKDVFIKIDEENEDISFDSIEEWKANAEDSSATDWIEADPAKLVVAIFNDAIRIFSMNSKSVLNAMSDALIVYNDLTYKEIYDILVENIPRSKMVKCKVVENTGVKLNESDN